VGRPVRQRLEYAALLAFWLALLGLSLWGALR
jgi:hypothetical protein